uniref:Ferredoxin n=1 Tax=Candidatus Kentrum sp. FM TaxID=2126340 RepID=A0A450W6H1_9GAMM|nr:MAG: Ferredoxin [Candidatus Kentron sp. FM]VFJ68925.1 MAG: Ferredoxin [Candidatus Kentron sp. FM]VFK12635.1 MAG: Ferredoxin [Candidatus Kentron sp. FM]
MSLLTDGDKVKTSESSGESTVHHPSTRDEQAIVADRTEIPLRVQAVKKVTSEDDTLRMLRAFYLGNPGVPDPEEGVDGRYLPAFLNPYRNESILRHDYPLFLVASVDTDAAETDTLPSSSDASQPIQSHSGVFPLPGLFNDLLLFSDLGGLPKKSQRLLEENLLRLEKHIVESITHGDDGDGEPREASTVLDRAMEALLASLHLDDKQREQLEAGLVQLEEKMPVGRFLPFSRYAPLYMLTHMAKRRFRSQRARILVQIENFVDRLNALLVMEKSKSIEAIEPRMVLDSIGSGGERFLDPLALSNLMDHRHGSQTMSPERHQRILEVLEILENERATGIGAPQLLLVRGTAARGVYGLDSDRLPAALSEEWELHESSNPFVTAMTVFDKQVIRLTRLARAMRIAALELENNYDPDIHDAWFSSFDWRTLSEQESKLMPLVLVVDSASNVVHHEFFGFSRLLHADRPIQVILEVQPSADPGEGDESIAVAYGEANNGMARRTELGYLGISHRQAVVVQSSATRPQHLLTGFGMALRSRRPTLCLLGSGYSGEIDQPPPLSLWPWFFESAAVESRAHPLFQYNPASGGEWPVTLSLVDNLQLEIDWPRHPFQYRTEDGTVTEITMTFGFADYALLDPRWRQHFYPVPDTLDAKEIIHLDDYLALSPAQRGSQLPFLWAVRDDKRTRGTRLTRLIVSTTLVEACLDRREFWHTLQAMAGVRNHHVEIAVSRLKAKAEERAQAQRILLTTKHQEELTRVRKEAGADALRRLTESLLVMDFSSAPAPSDTGDRERDDRERNVPLSPVAEQTESNIGKEHPPPVDKGKEPDLDAGAEPWIDTPLCTTCNECTDLNPRLFVYNDDKQAEIGDPAAGTHEQWLQAAELCPAQCIHP